MMMRSTAAGDAGRASDLRLRTALVAMGASVTGTAVTLLVLTYVLSARGSYSTGVLVAADVLPTILLGAPAGLLVDRLSNRLLAALSSVGQGLGIAVILAWINSSWVPYVGLAIVAAFGAVGVPAIYGVLSAAASDDRHRGRLYASAAGVQTLGGTVGAAGGGLLLAAVGSRWCLAIDACSYLLAAAALTAVQADRKVGSADHGHAQGKRRLLDGFRLLWADEPIRIATSQQALVVGLAVGVNVVDVFFVRGTLHLGAAYLGVISAVWGLGVWAGTRLHRLIPSGDVPALRRITGATVLLAVMVALPVLLATPYVQLPSWFIGGAMVGFQGVAVRVLTTRRTPEHALGRTIAAGASVITTASVVAIPVMTAALIVFGARASFGVAAGLTLLAVGMCSPVLLRVMRPGLPDQRVTAQAESSR